MFVYLITNKKNGKRYVGQTVRTVEQRFKEHCKGDITPIDKAIQNYGAENFTVETIQKCSTIEELNSAEKFWIKKLNSQIPNGYNVKAGGNNFVRGYIKRNKNIKTNISNGERSIGFYLKRFREEYGLTQNQVATKIGILQQVYYKYESDKSSPSVDVVLKISQAYDVSADYLLGRCDNPKSHKITPAEVNLLNVLNGYFLTK